MISVNPPPPDYETDTLLAQYCEAHYGPDYFGVENFSKACVAVGLAASGGRPCRRALDVGCALGRAAFELARHAARVDAMDASERFIRAACDIQATGLIRYAVIEEGDIVCPRQCRLSDLDLAAHADRVVFRQADAMALPADAAGYDLVLAANLVDRLPDPGIFLDAISHRLTAGGVLVVASPYTWLDAVTPPDRRLGGVYSNGRPMSSLEGMRERLKNRFDLIDRPRDIPFVIRETARKFQHSISQVTVWRRTAAI